MVILRPTRKLRELVPESLDSGTVSSTALGDWYANRILVDRQPLVLLISSLSLLPVPLRSSLIARPRPWRVECSEWRFPRSGLPVRWKP
jgi:hypothetical protein